MFQFWHGLVHLILSLIYFSYLFVDCMMTSSNGNVFRVTGHLCGEFTGPPVNSPHKGQWRGALIFSLICVWINGWVNNREAGDLRRYRAHYDVSVMDLSDAYCITLRPLPWTFYSAITFTAQKSDPLLRKRFKILTWRSNYIHYKMCDEINCPNLNSAISKFGNG